MPGRRRSDVHPRPRGVCSCRMLEIEAALALPSLQAGRPAATRRAPGRGGSAARGRRRRRCRSARGTARCSWRCSRETELPRAVARRYGACSGPASRVRSGSSVPGHRAAGHGGTGGGARRAPTSARSDPRAGCRERRDRSRRAARSGRPAHTTRTVMPRCMVWKASSRTPSELPRHRHPSRARLRRRRAAPAARREPRELRRGEPQWTDAWSGSLVRSTTAACGGRDRRPGDVHVRGRPGSRRSSTQIAGAARRLERRDALVAFTFLHTTCLAATGNDRRDRAGGHASSDDPARRAGLCPSSRPCRLATFFSRWAWRWALPRPPPWSPRRRSRA